MCWNCCEMRNVRSCGKRPRITTNRKIIQAVVWECAIVPDRSKTIRVKRLQATLKDGAFVIMEL